jgi:hypothetical protein
MVIILNTENTKETEIYDMETVLLLRKNNFHNGKKFFLKF